MNALVSRMLFHNPNALRSYMQGEFPAIKDIIRDVYVEEWRNEHHLSDHYLKNRRDLVLGLDSDYRPSDVELSDLILRVLDDIGQRYLYWNGNQLFVNESLFGEWQALLSRISPLLVMCRMVQRHAGPCPRSRTAQSDYVRQWLLPNFHVSALPYPSNPVVDGFIRRDGLVEIHCHLNGSTEFDHIWIDAVSRPVPFYRELVSGYQGVDWYSSYVQEQYEQLERGLRPVNIWQRLQAARNLRHKICRYLFEGADLGWSRVRRDAAIDVFGVNMGWNTHQHPAEDFLWRSDRFGGLVLEAGLLINILTELETRRNKPLAHAFYFCQLVSALIVKLVVQQVEQSGFDQFQKITLNEARTPSEKEYARRFRQLDVTEAGDLKYLEGRFAPKTVLTKMMSIQQKIEQGFQTFKTGGSRSELGLICHFIKKPEVSMPIGYRHYELRHSLELEGRVLVAACDPKRVRARRWLVGIDAASNELQAPPEVFAPLFRWLRRRGATNFTYHVGEDFVHLLSGMRAIYEAVVFLSLRPGNRLGHCTAIGVDPDLWCSRVGKQVVMRQGDHLDDLVFAYYRAIVLPEFSASVQRIVDEIEKLSKRVYGSSYSPQTLYNAWQLRKIDPMLTFNPSLRRRIIDERDREEEETILQELWTADNDSMMLFYDYHGQQRRPLSQVYRQWNRLIEVDVDIVPTDILWSLQERQLQELVDLNIAIESLPTSNVRISIYHDYSEHHLFRWLGLTSKQGCQPIICIGSDDPGIFATSLRAEFYHIYRELTQTLGKTPTDALAILERLGRNADTFRFGFEKNIRQR